MMFVGTLSAAATSMSLEPLASELNISWDNDNGSALQNSVGTWFFSILDPPSSNDQLALQAVGESVPYGSTITQDNDSDSGSTSPNLNGTDNGDGTITWTAISRPSVIAFKFAEDWYSVWTTHGAVFDAATGLWSDTITIGDAPRGSMSHTAAVVPDGGVTVALLGLSLFGLTGFYRLVQGREA